LYFPIGREEERRKRKKGKNGFPVDKLAAVLLLDLT
jgi:hypothetical protein